MKNFLLPLLAMLCFAQCKTGGGGGGKPETVAMGFLKSFASLDFDKCMKYCTEDSKKLVEMMKGMVDMVGEEERATFKATTEESLKNLKKVTCRIDGDKAFCKTCCDESGNESTEEDVKLVKENGKWLVLMSKEDLQSGK